MKSNEIFRLLFDYFLGDEVQFDNFLVILTEIQNVLKISFLSYCVTVKNLMINQSMIFTSWISFFIVFDTGNNVSGGMANCCFFGHFYKKSFIIMSKDFVKIVP